MKKITKKEIAIIILTLLLIGIPSRTIEISSSNVTNEQESITVNNTYHDVFIKVPSIHE